MRIFAGLTGGIAGGKSAAATLFASYGLGIIDADVLSREVIAPDSDGEKQLKTAFLDCFDGDILNRLRLRDRIFNDDAAREMLNRITHPLIRDRAMAQFQTIAAPIVLFVAPLLFESGLDVLTKPNITVSCHAETRINRLTVRDNIDRTLAQKILDAQWTDEMRQAHADYVIDNNGTPSQLQAEVERVVRALKAYL